MLRSTAQLLRKIQLHVVSVAECTEYCLPFPVVSCFVVHSLCRSCLVSCLLLSAVPCLIRRRAGRSFSFLTLVSAVPACAFFFSSLLFLQDRKTHRPRCCGLSGCSFLLLCLGQAYSYCTLQTTFLSLLLPLRYASLVHTPAGELDTHPRTPLISLSPLSPLPAPSFSVCLPLFHCPTHWSLLLQFSSCFRLLPPSVCRPLSLSVVSLPAFLPSLFPLLPVSVSVCLCLSSF